MHMHIMYIQVTYRFTVFIFCFATCICIYFFFFAWFLSCARTPIAPYNPIFLFMRHVCPLCMSLYLMHRAIGPALRHFFFLCLSCRPLAEFWVHPQEIPLQGLEIKMAMRMYNLYERTWLYSRWRRVWRLKNTEGTGEQFKCWGSCKLRWNASGRSNKQKVSRRSIFSTSEVLVALSHHWCRAWALYNFAHLKWA